MTPYFFKLTSSLKTERGKPLLLALMSLGFFVFFLLALSAAMQRPSLPSALNACRSIAPADHLQAAMLGANLSGRAEHIVVGDTGFIASVKDIAPQSKTIRFVTYKTNRPSDAAAVMMALQDFPTKTLIIQSPLVSWMNIKRQVPRQQMDLWMETQPGDKELISIPSVRRFFEELNDCARQRRRDSKQRLRFPPKATSKNRLVVASYLPVLREAWSDFDGKLEGRALYFVMDDVGTPENIRPSLQETVTIWSENEEMIGGFGHKIALDELGAVFSTRVTGD